MMNWGKKRASIKQKVDSLKTGKSYARLFIKKKAKRKLYVEPYETATLSLIKKTEC